MNSVWETLGIDPTDELKAIKKAYAKGLKAHHPEEDPTGYQNLREAYDFAVKLAKQENSSMATVEGSYISDEDAYVGEATTSFTDNPVELLIKRVEELYKDFYERIRIENWEELLQDDVIWNVQYSELLQDCLIDFLKEHPFLPIHIWELFDQTFHWTEDSEILEERYGQETTEFLIENIIGSKQMGYDFFSFEIDIDYEVYLNLREMAPFYLMENNLNAAKEVLEQAFQLVQTDPDLLHLQAIYYVRIQEEQLAKNAFERKLAIYPADPDALLYLAKFHIQNDSFTEAIQLCDRLLEKQPNHADGIFLIIKSYIGLNDEKTAYEWIKKAIELHPERPEFQIYQAKVFNLKTRQVPIPKHDFKFKAKYVFTLAITYIFITLRRAWVYLLPFLILLCTPLPFTYTAILLIPIAWEFGKVLKGENFPILSQNKNKRREHYFRCLSAPCINSSFLERYLATYHFTLIRDRLIGKRFLTNVLKEWEINNPKQLTHTINALFEGDMCVDFNQYLHQLMPLTEKARTIYIGSISKDDPNYSHFYLANRGVHTLTNTGVAAVDWAWSIYLCRVGNRLGYLTAKETRQLMTQAARWSQENYASWAEYFIAFHLGSHFKMKDSKFNRYAKYGLSSIFGLLVRKDSPLLKIKWKNDLLHNPS